MIMLINSSTLCFLRVVTLFGCLHIFQAFSLYSSRVRSNQISRDGIKAISSFLLNNPPLRVLNIAYNRAEDDGAIALSDALSKTNLTLET